MAFDFDSNIFTDSIADICDYEDTYRDLVEQINKAVTDIHKPDRNKSLQYATLCRDPKGNWYIDCYKSNWDRYKEMPIYHAFWKIIKDNINICYSLRWKLNPFLCSIRLDPKEIHHTFLFMTDESDSNSNDYMLDIPFMKEAMEFMYGNSFLRKTDYVHTIDMMMFKNDPYYTFKNSYEELNEFVSWIKEKIKVPKKKSKWIVDTTNFVFKQNMQQTRRRRLNFFDIVEKMADHGI